ALRRCSLALTRRAGGRTGWRLGIRARRGIAIPGPDLPRRRRGGLLVAGGDRVWRIDVLVAVPLRAASCQRAFAGLPGRRRGRGREIDRPWTLRFSSAMKRAVRASLEPAARAHT